jgi:hypothetical protein
VNARPLTPHQRREAIARRDSDDEMLTHIADSYNVSHSTISRVMIDRRFCGLGIAVRRRAEINPRHWHKHRLLLVFPSGDWHYAVINLKFWTHCQFSN